MSENSPRVAITSFDSLLSQREPTGGANAIDLLRTGIVISGDETITCSGASPMKSPLAGNRLTVVEGTAQHEATTRRP